MGEEYKVLKKIAIILETSHPEVAAYLGAYIDGIHDTCAWIGKVSSPNVKVDRNRYMWIVNLKERLNLSNASEEEIRSDFERQINNGLEHILLNKSKFDFKLQIKEVKR